MNNYFVRHVEDVAWNFNTLPEILERLANYEDSYVREGVAFNPNTPQKTLARLANDEDWVVRLGVARNPNTPQYIKDYLKIKKFLNYYE